MRSPQPLFCLSRMREVCQGAGGGGSLGVVGMFSIVTMDWVSGIVLWVVVLWLLSDGVGLGVWSGRHGQINSQSVCWGQVGWWSVSLGSSWRGLQILVGW